MFLFHPFGTLRLSAFSVPSVNFKDPMRRYHWKILPQGMQNSTTFCQKFVAQAKQNIRDQFPQVYIIHYMDDVLLANKNEGVLLATYDQLQQSLAMQG